MGDYTLNEVFKVVKTDRQFPEDSTVKVGGRAMVAAMSRRASADNRKRQVSNAKIEDGSAPLKLVELAIYRIAAPPWEDVTDAWKRKELANAK